MNTSTSTTAADELARRGIHIKRTNLWRAFRHRDIEPLGPTHAMYVTAEQLDRFTAAWRPVSVPQRAPHRPGPSISISQDTSSHRPRLALRIERVIVTAHGRMLERRQEVAERRARTGENARAAVEAIWPGQGHGGKHGTKNLRL